MESVRKAHGLVPNRLTHTLLLAGLAWVTLVPVTHAESTPAPKCALEPPPPSDTHTMTGFPAERIYIHPKHPQLCVNSNDKTCDATAYVIPGDTLKTSSDCSGWTFVEFDGKKKTTGWVATTRMTTADASKLPQPADSIPSTKLAACREAERAMNASLRNPQNGKSALPTALENPTKMDKLPKGVSEYDEGTWGVTVSEAHIQGHTLKAVAYTQGGTCYEDFLELWDPAFHKRLSVPSSNTDNGENAEGYSSESLVKLDNQPYFAHFSRSGNVTLLTFDKDLSAHPVCEVRLSASKVEAVKTAADQAVCEAVRTGSISGAPIQDIVPYDLTPESFHFDHGEETFENTRNGLRIIARGRLDVDNDGKPDDVGILAFGNGVDTAGCGHDVDAVVPIKLNPDGTPVAGSAFNLKMIESAGSGEDGRLLMIHGKVYFETRSHTDADGGIQHTVTELSATGRKTVCEFQPVEYKAVDTQ